MAEKLTFLTNKDKVQILTELVEKSDGKNLFTDLNFIEEEIIYSDFLYDKENMRYIEGEVGDVRHVINIPEGSGSDSTYDALFVCVESNSSDSKYVWTELPISIIIRKLFDGVISRPMPGVKTGSAVTGEEVFKYIQSKVGNPVEYLGEIASLDNLPESIRPGDVFKLEKGAPVAQAAGLYIMSDKGPILLMTMANVRNIMLDSNRRLTASNDKAPTTGAVVNYVDDKLSEVLPEALKEYKLFSDFNYNYIGTWDGVVSNTEGNPFTEVGQIAYSTQLNAFIQCVNKVSEPGSAAAIEYEQLPIGNIIEKYILNMDKATVAEEGNRQLATSDLVYRTAVLGMEKAMNFVGTRDNVPSGTQNAEYKKNDVILVDDKIYIFDGGSTPWKRLSSKTLLNTHGTMGHMNFPLVSDVTATNSYDFDSGSMYICYTDNSKKQYALVVAGARYWYTIPLGTTISTQVDSTDTSSAVCGKAVADYVTRKLVYDETPTEGSTNAVTSGGVYSAIADIVEEKLNNISTMNLEFTLEDGSTVIKKVMVQDD